LTQILPKLSSVPRQFREVFMEFPPPLENLLAALPEFPRDPGLPARTPRVGHCLVRQRQQGAGRQASQNQDF
jgi:hypothetical protein